MDHPLLARHAKAIRDLCAQFHVRRLELFGSASRGEDKAASDFDFIVEFEELPPLRHGDCYFGMLFGLEDLLRHPIDLLTVESIKNPYFLEEIKPDRSVVYEHSVG